MYSSIVYIFTSIMAQSLFHIYTHLVFHVKNSSPQILQEDKKRLHNYLLSAVEERHCKVIAIDGTVDHVHILLKQNKIVDLTQLIADLKRSSSRWLKSLSQHYSTFYWQGGYGVFSVSPRDVIVVKRYIDNQESHHSKVSTFDEMKVICDRSGCDYDPQFLLSD